MPKITGKDLQELVTTTTKAAVKATLEEIERLKNEPPGKKKKPTEDKPGKKKGAWSRFAEWVDGEEEEASEEEDETEEEEEEESA